MENELVSVIIPNYNRAEILKDTVLSVLNQTYKNIEIIVVDDKSTDDSREVIADMSNEYENFRYFLSNKNKGANYCRNKGVELSNGKYIAFLDSDDQFLPNKIDKQIKVFKRNVNNNVGIVYSNMLIGEKKVLTYNGDTLIKLKDIIFRNKLGGFSTVLIKREVFFEAGKLDENLLSCQDWDFYLKILSKYNGYMISQPLVKYFLQADSISRNVDKVLQGHHLIFNKITIINKQKGLVSNNLLAYHQNLLFGDIYRNFMMIDKAKENYKYCLKYKWDIRTALLFFSTLGGKSTYKLLFKFKSMIVS